MQVLGDLGFVRFYLNHGNSAVCRKTLVDSQQRTGRRSRRPLPALPRVGVLLTGSVSLIPSSKGELL